MIERIGKNKLQLMELVEVVVCDSGSAMRQSWSRTRTPVQVAGALHGNYLSAGPAAFVGVQEDGQPWQFTSQPAQSVMFVQSHTYDKNYLMQDITYVHLFNMIECTVCQITQYKHIVHTCSTNTA